MEPVGGLGELATKALLPAGVSSMGMWGRTKFAFGKFEKEKKSLSLSLRRETPATVEVPLWPPCFY